MMEITDEQFYAAILTFLKTKKDDKSVEAGYCRAIVPLMKGLMEQAQKHPKKVHIGHIFGPFGFSIK
jgi:hypothetical protein